MFALAALAASFALGPPARGAAGATISGTVLEDQNGNRLADSSDTPARGATIDLERRVDGQIAWFVTLFADQQGSFAFTDVPPGDYMVIAYWTGGRFIVPSNRPQVPGASAEIAVTVGGAGDPAKVTFLVQYGFGYPGPAEARSPRYPEGVRSVAGQVVPELPTAAGLEHRIIVGPGVREVRLTPLKGPSETHPLRFDRFLCDQVPVLDGVADVIPRFTFACPPGSRIGLTLFYTDGSRTPSAATAEPPIEWRLALPGEALHTVRAVVAPPQVGEAGLKSVP